MQPSSSTGRTSHAALVSAGARRLSYRDVTWAFHSESQEILLQESSKAFEGKMLWEDARSLGTFLWLKSSEALVRSS